MTVSSIIKTCVVGLPLLAAAPALAAGNGADKLEVLTQGTLHEALFDLQFDGEYGVAVGMPALLVETEDGGKTWSRTLKPEAGGAFLGADTKDGQTLVVGQLGLVARKDGDDWELLDRPTEERLLSVALAGGGTAYVAGGFGTLLKSTNMGDSWVSIAPDYEPLMHDFVQPHLNDIVVATTGTIYVAGEFGFVMRSEDGGESWVVDRSSKEGAPSIFGLYEAADGTVWGVGQRGFVLRRDSATGEWAQVKTGTDAILLDISANNEGLLLVTGIRKMLVINGDDLSVSTIVNTDIKTNWYQGVATPGGGSDGAHILVGHQARILKNRN